MFKCVNDVNDVNDFTTLILFNISVCMYIRYLLHLCQLYHFNLSIITSIQSNNKENPTYKAYMGKGGA